MEGTPGWLKDLIRDIPDFPQPGVVFKDITPLLASAAALSWCVEALAGAFQHRPIDKVIGIEARGFILAAPVAVHLGAGFVPVRKAGQAAVARDRRVLRPGIRRRLPGDPPGRPGAGRAGPDHRRRAGHGRDGGGHGPAGPGAWAPRWPASAASSSWPSSAGAGSSTTSTLFHYSTMSRPMVMMNRSEGTGRIRAVATVERVLPWRRQVQTGRRPAAVAQRLPGPASPRRDRP